MTDHFNHHSEKNRRPMLYITFFILFIFLCPFSTARAKSPGQDALDLGTRLYKNEDYKEALEAFKKAAESDPALLKAWENLGWAHHKLSQNQDAITIWDTLLKIKPEQTPLLNQIGIIYFESGSWEKAIQRFEESLKITPKQTDIEFRLALAYVALGQPDKAASIYKNIFKEVPDNAKAVLHLAALYEKQNQPEKAIALLKERIAASEKTSPLLRPHLGRLLARKAENAYKKEAYEDSEALYREAIDWEPTQVQYLANLGWALRKKGATEQAITYWNTALALSDNAEEIHHSLADAYFELGEDEKAREHYQSAWAQGRDEATILHRLGEIAFRKKDPATALGLLSSLLEKMGEDEVWANRVSGLFVQYDYVDQGFIFLKNRLKTGTKPERLSKAMIKLYSAQATEAAQAEQWDKAITAYQEILLIDAQHGQTLRDLGWIYWRKAAWHETEQTWLAYRTVYPNLPEPYRLLTRLYLQTKNYPEAIKMTQESLKIFPDQPDLKLSLAKAQFWDHQFLEAKRSAKTLAAAYPEHLPIQFFWGELLIQYGDFERAKTQWEKVLALGSSAPRARYYFIRSLHETGAHADAVHQANEGIALHGPEKDLMRFLAQDATVRVATQDALHWYRLLTRHYPEEISYWLETSKIYQQLGNVSENTALMEEAKKHHPKSQKIAMETANVYRLAGQLDQAERIYRRLLKTYPHHQDAFIGLFETLLADKRLDEALHLLENQGADFLSDYEMAFQRARIHADMGQIKASRAYIQQVTIPEGKNHYLPILLYHGLSLNPRSTLLSVAHFDEQLKFLKDQGYQSITLNELSEMMDGKIPFPEKPILLTFDDARLDAFILGDPVLKKHKMKATMFVPTAKILAHDPFFADWSTIQFYGKTGRWEYQSHGHLAHDPIPIDGAGKEGTFLVNKKWLPEKNRLETDEEYLSRLEKDYIESGSLLRKEGSNRKVIGYSFPFSEAGQGSLGNMPEATRLNEGLLARYYRFGFIQDQAGYTILKEGGPSPMMLRRYTVPSSWGGEHLIRHLARRHPQNVSRIRLGQSYFWNGEYNAADKIFSELAERTPLLMEETQYYLGAIAYEQFQYLEAKNHLKPVFGNNAFPEETTKKLTEKIAWKSDPQIEARIGFSPESGERLRHWETLRVLYPLKNNVHLWGETGLTHFREKGFESLWVQELSIGAQWFAKKGLAVDGAFRQRQRERGAGSQNIWLGARYGTGLHTLRLNWSYEDIETLRAHEADLQAHHLKTTVSLRMHPQWNSQLSLAYLNYDDKNTRTDLGTQLRHRLIRWPDWQIGTRLAFRDARFQSNRYYTPEGLYETEANLVYRRAWDLGWVLEGEGGLGWADDRIHGARWIRHGRVLLKKVWTDTLHTQVQAELSRSPGYSRGTLEAVLQYRF